MAASPDATVELDHLYHETVNFHGREYQRYSIENNVYFSPIDEDEAERLLISHEALRVLFDNRLIFPSIHRLRKVLDCGFGTGSWAIEVARSHPKCEVVGIDISPHMAQEDVLPNLDLQVDDLNKRFTFARDEFDLIHSQMMAGGIDSGRWRSYLKDMHRSLRPGGWCQIVEIYYQAQSDNGTLTDTHGLRVWSHYYLEAASQYKNPRAPVRMESLVREAGFTDVEARMMQLPMSAWPTDPRMREVGRINRDNVQMLLSSQALYLFTEKLGYICSGEERRRRMPYDQAQVIIAKARSEADRPSIKAYFPLYVCIGRKRH